MKMFNLTFEKNIMGESFIVASEDNVKYIEEIGKGPTVGDVMFAKNDKYIFGPVVDRLHEYESLGYEPHELEKIIATLKRLLNIS